MDTQPQSKPLIDKVRDWLGERGYPLEFRTASLFQRAGFDTLQGFYVREPKSNLVREIDILAKIRGESERIHIEISFIVECKWSRDKPWVVFTAPRTRMAPSACIAQSISSILCEAAMHCLAANEDLHALSLFSSKGRNGFGGRRAFSKDDDQDHFYTTVQSVVSKALNYVADMNEDCQTGKMPEFGCVIFPLIVLEGDLFEAYFDQSTNDVCLNPVDFVRLHWRGAGDLSQWISTVDVVRSSRLEALLSTRKKEMESLRDEIQQTITKLIECDKGSTLAPLDIQRIPRGYIGLPPLLREIWARGKKGQ